MHGRKKPEEPRGDVPNRVGRRAFLLGAGATATTASAIAAARLGSVGSDPAAGANDTIDKHSLEYVETEHIRAFYARARF